MNITYKLDEFTFRDIIKEYTIPVGQRKKVNLIIYYKKLKRQQ